MAVITFQTPDGEKTIASMVVEYDKNRSAWIVDVSDGDISDVGSGVEQLVIPETRVYKVELTNDETVNTGTGTF